MDLLQEVVHVPGVCMCVCVCMCVWCVCVCGPAAELYYYLDVEYLCQRE